MYVHHSSPLAAPLAAHYPSKMVNRLLAEPSPTLNYIESTAAASRSILYRGTASASSLLLFPFLGLFMTSPLKISILRNRYCSPLSIDLIQLPVRDVAHVFNLLLIL